MESQLSNSESCQNLAQLFSTVLQQTEGLPDEIRLRITFDPLTSLPQAVWTFTLADLRELYVV